MAAAGRGCAAAVLALLLALALALAGAERAESAERCPAGQLAAYRVAMRTYWTRERFPKHFPEWRPPAHWSRLVGFSHGPSFVLFRVGTRASPGVRQLAEAGRADALHAAGVAQGAAGLLDEFSAPPLPTGAGRADAFFFADANHSRVSLMARMAPSPDWFVGLDSFELCVGGAWLDSITLEADPLDAGSDSGFTFTAPRWPTEPPGTVFRVTSRFPPHPAGSFYYPALRRLPPIAAFSFRKVREYELTGEFAGADALPEDPPPLRPAAPPPPPPPRGDADLQAELAEEALEAEAPAPPRWPPHAAAGPSKLANKGPPPHGNATLLLPLAPPDGGAAKLNGVTGPGGGGSGGRAGKPRKHHWRSSRPAARDCRVGEWAEWSACSRSCGAGERQRRRAVERAARRGGRDCPPLLQTQLCGGPARDCRW